MFSWFQTPIVLLRRWGPPWNQSTLENLNFSNPIWWTAEFVKKIQKIKTDMSTKVLAIARNSAEWHLNPPGTKFTGRRWKLASPMSRFNSHTPFAGSRTSSYTAPIGSYVHVQIMISTIAYCYLNARLPDISSHSLNAKLKIISPGILKSTTLKHLR